MSCEHCSCYTVKERKCCYCHEGENNDRRIDELMRKSIIKAREKKENNDE